MIPEDFGYAKHPELRKWIEREYPTLDPDQTMERFIEYADDSGRMATKWTAAFKRVVRTGMENGWKGICVFKQGRAHDPQWIPVLKEAQLLGFREPEKHESPGGYRTAMEQWKRMPKAPVIEFGDALKKMGGA